MKSLKAFKNLKSRLEKQIAVSAENLSESRKAYVLNPSTITMKALKKANENLDNLERKLEGALEIINHYDFYLHCWEEEQIEKDMLKAYINNH